MADKTIGSLPQVASLTDNSSFVCEYNGEAKRVTGKQFKDFAKQGVSDEAEAQIQAIQYAGDAQNQRVTNEGTIQTANAKAQADAAAQSASGAAQSAKEAAESAAVYDTVVADVTQLKKDILTKADKTALAKTDRSIDALWKLNQGISYQFETDDTAAYQKTVPSGAELASVGSIGGKTQVWNQLNANNAYSGSTTYRGVTYTYTDKSVTVNGTANPNSALALFLFAEKYIDGHKILVLADKYSDGTWGFGINGTGTPVYGKMIVGYAFNPVVFVKDGVTVNNETISLQMFDLTAMFGSGNEPTSIDDPRIAWIKQYAAAHPEYNAGALVSADVETITCNGANVLDLSAFESNEQYGVKLENTGNGVIRVTGTATETNQVWFGWYKTLQKKASSYTIKSFSSFQQDWNTKGCLQFFNSDNTLMVDYGNGKQGFIANDGEIRICLRVISGVTYDDTVSISVCVGDQTISKYTPAREPIQKTIPESVRNLPGYGWSAGDVYNSIERTDNGWQYVQRVGSREYQDGDTVTDGVTTYYVLDNPVITDITDLMDGILDAITVEGGGTLTFENAAKLDVPNTVEYAVKLSEVGA